MLIESMREFQNELDAKNQIALQQLNKDIDLLNSLPPGNLPIFDNKINSNSQNLNYENVPDSYNNAPSLNLDLSSRLAEVKEFNASFIPLASEEKRRENIEALMAFARTGEDAPKTNLEANGVSSASLDALHQATLDMDNRDKEFKKSMQEFTSRLEGLQTPIDQEPTSQIPQSLGTDINEKYKSNEIFQPGTYHSNERYQSNLAQKTDPNTGRLQPSRHEHLLPTPEVPQTPYNPANWKDNAQADNIMDFKETLSKLSLLSPESNRNALDSPLDSQPKREYVPLKYEGSQELLPKFASVLSAPDLSIPDFEKKYLHPNVNTPSTFNPSRTEPVPSMFNSTKTDPTRNDYVLPSIHLLDSVRLQDSGLPPRGNNHSISTSGPAHEPQESSKAIVNALRILQDRVGKLETEKSQARLKIHDLERELDSTKRLLRQQPPLSDEFSPGRNVYSQSPNVSPTKSNSGTLDSTMKNILDARQKVDMLKERVDHVRHLTEGSQFNHATALPTNLSGDFGQGQKYDSDFGVMGQYNFDRDLAKNDEELGKYDIKRDAKRVVDAVESPSFDRILQSHSDKILKEEGAFVNSYLPSTSKNSWEKSPTSIHKSKSPERSAQDQIKQLREDILKEKEIRLGSVRSKNNGRVQILLL